MNGITGIFFLRRCVITPTCNSFVVVVVVAGILHKLDAEKHEHVFGVGTPYAPAPYLKKKSVSILRNAGETGA